MQKKKFEKKIGSKFLRQSAILDISVWAQVCISDNNTWKGFAKDWRSVHQKTVSEHSNNTQKSL